MLTYDLSAFDSGPTAFVRPFAAPTCELKLGYMCVNHGYDARDREDANSFSPDIESLDG
jgi:hypothetical protein